jgi:hypothetical protein
MKTFSDGLNQDIAPINLPITALTRCKNMKYAINKSVDGQNTIVLKARQGTEKLSATALASEMKACTYYIAGSQYIVATSSKVYYLNGSYAPVEIGSISGTPTFTEFKGKLIIHDSGVTKAWNGTTFETLTGLYTNEIIGTGDGGTVDFTGTLDYPAIKPGSLTITYTDTTTKTITDDGAGALIGDVAADTNTITYATGAFSFRCSGTPDNTTSIYATYEKVAGAPKSTAGFVRASRLYMWGDSDNPSRLWYSAANDEDAWHSSSSGGCLDADPLDGYSITGCVNFFQTVVIIKGNSLKRLDNFPGDTIFRVEPLLSDIGGNAYRTCLSDGNIISFLSKEGWLGLGATETYGDIAKTFNFSEKFRTSATRYGNTLAYSEYNQIDKQFWLTLFNSTTQIPVVYVINMETGGQLSLYEFAFDHTCYKFVNNEMLIGGSDGHLYRLFNDNSRYRDNGVSYAADTYIRGVMTNWGIPVNRKHNKKIYPHIYGKVGMTATLNIYTDNDYETPIYTTSLTVPSGDALIFDDGQDVLIYDLDGEIGSGRVTDIHKKFNYREVMFEITNISGALGGEFFGLDFFGPILGD